MTDLTVEKHRRIAEAEYRKARKEASKSAMKIAEERQTALTKVIQEQMEMVGLALRHKPFSLAHLYKSGALELSTVSMTTRCAPKSVSKLELHFPWTWTPFLHNKPVPHAVCPTQAPPQLPLATKLNWKHFSGTLRSVNLT